jgi:hypothetical protein
VEFTMKRWIIAVLLAIFLSSPVVSGAVDDPLDTGKANLFNVPFFKVPFGSNPDSNDARDKKEEGTASDNAAKEKEKQNKKVDDAIKKAWEER